MSKTIIEWVARPGTIPESWNVITGCTKVSEGCRNCYAERIARRLAGRFGYPESPHHFDVTEHLDKQDLPRQWKTPRTVFVCSMSDFAHPKIGYGRRAVLWTEMERASQHTFLILTKRPGELLIWLRWLYDDGEIKVLPNVWIGVTAENQAMANERIPLLLQIPAAVRFLSCEPLLGFIDLTSLKPSNGTLVNALTGEERYMPSGAGMRIHGGLDWVIVGGESGRSARPMDPQWAKSIRDQCQTANVAYFHKQNGEFVEVTEDFRGNDTVLMHDGKVLGRYDAWADKVVEKGYTVVRRVGKRAAGHLLNGQECREWPKGSQL